MCLTIEEFQSEGRVMGRFLVDGTPIGEAEKVNGGYWLLPRAKNLRDQDEAAKAMLEGYLVKIRAKERKCLELLESIGVRKQQPKALFEFSLPPFIKAESWNGFVEMRKRIKKPLTPRATDMLIKKLKTFHDERIDVNDCLDRSTFKNWTDVYRPEGDKPQHQIVELDSGDET
jgi:hypothetical protein